MTIRKISSLLTLLVCFMVNATAQNLLNHIPKDAAFVVTMSPGVLNNKVELEKLKKFTFYQDMMKQAMSSPDEKEKEIANMLLNEPSKLGIDIMSSSHVFGKVDGDNMYVGALVKVSDKVAFNKFVTEQTADKDIKIMKKEGYEAFVKDDIHMAWNGNMAMFAGGFVMDEAAKEKTLAPAMVQEFITGTIVKSKPLNSIQTDPNYKLSSAKKYDASFWLDYEWVQTISQKAAKDEMAGAMGAMGPMYDKMMALYDDAYMFNGLNFDKGTVHMKSQIYGNDQLVSLWKNSTNNPINRNFAKYIPKDNLGYYAMGLNIKGMVSEMKKIFDPENTQMPMMESMATSMLKQQTGIEMTADQLYGMLKGDMVVTITGMREFEKEVTTYEYDDDFNAKEVKKMVKEEMPEFTMMMSYADEPALMKFIDLGEGMSMFKKQNGYYQAEIPGSPMDVYMRLKDGIMFVSNNTDVITNKKIMKKGISKKNRIGVDGLKNMLTNSQILHWDMSKTLALIGAQDFMSMAGDDKWMMKNAQETFKSMTMKVNNVSAKSINSDINLDFKDESTNSLEQMFRFIDGIYLLQKGGTSM